MYNCKQAAFGQMAMEGLTDTSGQECHDIEKKRISARRQGLMGTLAVGDKQGRGGEVKQTLRIQATMAEVTNPQAQNGCPM